MSSEGFPIVWEGTWRGDVTLTRKDGSLENVEMRLSIKPVTEQVTTWRIEYGVDPTREVREYEITPCDQSHGHYVIDEKNGILLDCRLIENRLYSLFQVEGALLSSRFDHQGDAIQVEIVSFDATAPRRTGLDTEHAKPIEVLSFPCRSLQQGTLHHIGGVQPLPTKS